MLFSFVSLSHHNDIIREKNMQIGYRDRRIAELDAERKLLWDKLCLLEIGETVFEDALALHAKQVSAPDFQSGVSETPARELAAALAGEPQCIKSKPDVAVRLGRTRPSQIMRRMDRLMHNRWLQKLRPAKSAERKREEVMAELNATHPPAVRLATAPKNSMSTRA